MSQKFNYGNHRKIIGKGMMKNAQMSCLFQFHAEIWTLLGPIHIFHTPLVHTNRTRTRLGWTFSNVSCIFVHPDLDSVQLFTGVHKRSIISIQILLILHWFFLFRPTQNKRAWKKIRTLNCLYVSHELQQGAHICEWRFFGVSPTILQNHLFVMSYF